MDAMTRPIHARTQRWGPLHPPSKCGKFQVLASGAWNPKPVNFPAPIVTCKKLDISEALQKPWSEMSGAGEVVWINKKP